jgi:hypothetical protein
MSSVEVGYTLGRKGGEPCHESGFGQDDSMGKGFLFNEAKGDRHEENHSACFQQ